MERKSVCSELLRGRAHGRHEAWQRARNLCSRQQTSANGGAFLHSAVCRGSRVVRLRRLRKTAGPVLTGSCDVGGLAAVLCSGAAVIRFGRCVSGRQGRSSFGMGTLRAAPTTGTLGQYTCRGPAGGIGSFSGLGGRSGRDAEVTLGRGLDPASVAQVRRPRRDSASAALRRMVDASVHHAASSLSRDSVFASHGYLAEG